MSSCDSNSCVAPVCLGAAVGAAAARSADALPALMASCWAQRWCAMTTRVSISPLPSSLSSLACWLMMLACLLPKQRLPGGRLPVWKVHQCRQRTKSCAALWPFAPASLALALAQVPALALVITRITCHWLEAAGTLPSLQACPPRSGRSPQACPCHAQGAAPPCTQILCWLWWRHNASWLLARVSLGLSARLVLSRVSLGLSICTPVCLGG